MNICSPVPALSIMDENPNKMFASYYRIHFAKIIMEKAAGNSPDSAFVASRGKNYTQQAGSTQKGKFTDGYPVKTNENSSIEQMNFNNQSSSKRH